MLHKSSRLKNLATSRLKKEFIKKPHTPKRATDSSPTLNLQFSDLAVKRRGFAIHGGPWELAQ